MFVSFQLLHSCLSVTSIYSNRRLRAIPTPIKPRYFISVNAPL